jgi:hypothetical protein
MRIQKKLNKMSSGDGTVGFSNLYINMREAWRFHSFRRFVVILAILSVQ